MRIGYVVTNFSPLSESFIRREVLALCRLGHRVFVYAHCLHYDPQAPQPNDPNLVIREIPFLTDPAALSQIALADSIDHLHGSLMSAAHRATFTAARDLQTPFTLMAYSGLDLFTRRDVDLYSSAARDPLCVRIIVEDSFMENWMTQQFGVPPGSLSIVPNSFDLDSYQLSEKRAPSQRLVILSIARFVPKKGLIYLIEAFQELSARHEETELWLVGYGPEERQLRQAASHNQRIKFHGASSEAETRRLYAAADIFCLPCIRTETGDADGIPTTILEAMAFELPIVTTDILSTSCYITDGCEGLLVPPHNSAALASALERLSGDPGLRAALGKAGRARVVKVSDIKRNITRLEQIFIEAADAKPNAVQVRDQWNSDRGIELGDLKSQSPLVSICITTYNRAALVRESIDSVLRQTYRNVEVLVVDDGSTDNTRRVLETYGSAIRAVYNETNHGMAFSKNRALLLTSEESSYVGILDSDDYFGPRFVERCVAVLQDHSEAGLVYTDDIMVDTAGRELWRQPAVGPWNMDVWLRTCNLRGDTWLARRALVMQTTLHDEATEHDHDYDLFFQLLKITTFVHLPEFLAFIRQHNGRSTMANRLALARDHAANLVKHGFSAEYAYLRARRNPEWVPAIEEGIKIGKRLYQQNRKACL